MNARANGHARMPGAEPAPGPSAAADDTAPEAGGDEAPVTFDAADALEELEQQGNGPAGSRPGVDRLPARHPSGRDVLLCWQLGEDDLGWWHLPEDGFAGRRPLPLPPEL